MSWIGVRTVIALSFAVLMLASVAAVAYTPFTNIAAVGGEPSLRLGGPGFQPPQAPSYDPVQYTLNLFAKVDTNFNGIEDALEAKLAELPSNETVEVIILYAAKPALLGGDRAAILETLNNLMRAVEAAGGEITGGPWKNVLVGFAAKVPVSLIPQLPNMVGGVDVDGDGLVNVVLVQEAKEYRALNYWSGKQMGVRPIVWFNMGVKGQGVTVAVLDTGIDGSNSAFTNKIVWWADYTGDPNGQIRNTPYDDNMHGTHVAGTVAGLLSGLDNQGRLVINFGIGDVSVTTTNAWLRWGYPFLAYYVNATGTIEINFKWNPDGTTAGAVGSVGLAYCGQVFYTECTNYNVVASVQTPNSNTWYNLTYDVTSPTQFGWYFLVFNMSTGGTVALLPIMRFPVDTTDATTIPYLAGMAPEASLGGGKVLSFYGGGTTTDIASAIDDVAGNATLVNPPMYIISMSLGGGYDTTIDTAVTNAAQSGVLSVVAAGNDGAGANNAGTGSPSSNPYAITVAAIDAMNNITDYSSEGGPSTTDNTVIKPDVAAPGGGEYMQIFSADTTWHDDLNNAEASGSWWNPTYTEDLDWLDTMNLNTEGFDDAIGIPGTSMATPHVSGVAALVISALINNASYTWTWDVNSPNLVKNIILMAAYETYPLMREPNNATYSPTLEKGGKDVHEGYGALDAAGAVMIALSYGPGKALLPGSVFEGTIRDGTAYNANFAAGNWKYPFGQSVFGYRVYFPAESFKLSNGTTYNIVYGFSLYANTSDIANTDFDLYLYQTTGNNYGEPVILVSSVQGLGVQVESFTYDPAAVGDAVLVVKRAREDSAGGPFLAAFGPYVSLVGYDQANTPVEGTAYTGRPLEVTVFSALGAATAEVTFYDNTTGTVLGTTTITLTQKGSYSTGSANWTVPADSTLDGHTIVAIVKLYDSANNLLAEGPAFATASVVATPTPIPEPGLVVPVLAALAAILYLLLSRRR